MFDIAVICLVVTALLAYVNHRFVGLPTTIGVMAIALLLSLGLIGLDHLGFSSLHDYETGLLQSIDFSELLMQGMLSVLLFAGAMHIDLGQLREFRWQVGTLAVAGTALSTAIVGIVLWWALPLLGFELSLGYCLVFGALISPTDPIAVLALLRSAGAPDNVRLLVSGESLFNDGVGVVLFSLLLAVAAQGQVPSLHDGAVLLAREAGGGLLLGALLGAALFYLLRSIDNYKVEVLLTLAGVLGGYQLAHALHTSGPLAMVVAGLIVGNQGRAYAMSEVTREHVDMFWELLDEILNAVLFVLLGLEIVLVHFNGPVLLASAVAIGVALLARLLAVGLPLARLWRMFRLPAGAWKILTWGGLRGGISVALVLSLPPGAQRDLLLAMTYAVVVFSILVQGTTIKPMVQRLLGTGRAN